MALQPRPAPVTATVTYVGAPGSPTSLVTEEETAARWARWMVEQAQAHPAAR